MLNALMPTSMTGRTRLYHLARDHLRDDSGHEDVSPWQTAFSIFLVRESGDCDLCS